MFYKTSIALFLFLFTLSNASHAQDWATTIKYVESKINGLSGKKHAYRFKSPHSSKLAPTNTYQIVDTWKKTNYMKGKPFSFYDYKYTYTFKLSDLKTVSISSEDVNTLIIKFKKSVSCKKYTRGVYDSGEVARNDTKTEKTYSLRLHGNAETLRKLRNALDRARVFGEVEAEKEDEPDPFDY